MKTIITKIKARLQDQITYVRDNDIYITEDDRLLRNKGDYPAIGIKDGPVQYALKAVDTDDVTYSVNVSAYVRLYKQEAGIIGDASASRKGVLDITEDIVAALKDYLLDGAVDLAMPESETGSELMIDEKTAIIKKTVTMSYLKMS